MTGNSVFHYGGHGGRYVSRFNTHNFTDGIYQVVWDVHGNQPSGVYGTMGCEIYGNKVSLARGTTIIDHRGGSCLLFQNTLTGTSGSWQAARRVCRLDRPHFESKAAAYFLFVLFPQYDERRQPRR